MKHLIPKSYLPFCLMLLLSPYQYCVAQNGTILFYDLNGKGLNSKEKAVFTRYVTFDQNNKPIDTVKDFNMNYKLIRKGIATMVDKDDDNKTIWIGKVYLYDEDGKLASISNYDEFGLLDGKKTTYIPKGKVANQIEFINPNGSILYYDINGKGVDTKKNAVLIRYVTFDENNKPIDTVRDFTINSKLLGKGMATVIDKFNDNKTHWIGQHFEYDEDGKLASISNYDEFGLLDGKKTTYNPKGLVTNEYEYAHGNPTKDYYIAYDKKSNPAKYSYLTHLPMRLATTDKVIVPITSKRIIYQDGIPVQYYFLNGLTVAVKISTQQMYGEYYEAYITIENGSNEEFDFDPTDITASLEKEGKAIDGEVMSYADYIKKVNRRQKWTAAFSAFAEAVAATSAGFSSSKVNATAQTSSGQRVTIQANTTSYNGAAAYSAQQNASNNMNQLANQQYEIRKSISEGYLKRNTIFPNTRIIGFVNIKHESADYILLNIPVNGKVYHFEWK